MVRPLLKKLLENHLKPHINDDQIISNFKQTIISDIKERFNLECDSESRVSVRQISSFLDPRYKNLDHEPIVARENIRSSVMDLLNSTNVHNVNTRREPSLQKSALEFLYGDDVTEVNDLTTEFQNYLAEPQLKFDLNSFDWWKSREDKYPAIGILAKKYLSIPATSVSSERCFSTAGNVVNSKRTSLLTKNVNLLVFLYQNRNLIP
ncbi:E3 SUMO-protein ligase ZBED1-like [Aphis gossypii]|uniref:E3 SUMO-protein ligase ZBED1-like n=1 Tax=Aphis gossypii TaxID=80765 RepID=UPI002158FCAB|nr:E3 SUMO-protein ligase ZBED1-like [Aphis gossypii]